MGSRLDSAGKFEIEAADDFVLQQPTILTNASFTGLIPVGSLVLNVVVEIYRVFPDDSNVGRTSGSPTFSTPQVPTRVNSPSDVAFTSRDGAGGDLTFATTALSGSFTALNSVQPGGIHPRPNQTTGGNGALSGEEVRLDVNFSVDVSLAADHYFFVPQVQLNTGDFYWLSAPKPIVAPGTLSREELRICRVGLAMSPWIPIGCGLARTLSEWAPSIRRFLLQARLTPPAFPNLARLRSLEQALPDFLHSAAVIGRRLKPIAHCSHCG